MTGINLQLVIEILEDYIDIYNSDNNTDNEFCQYTDTEVEQAILNINNITDALDRLRGAYDDLFNTTTVTDNTNSTPNTTVVPDEVPVDPVTFYGASFPENYRVFSREQIGQRRIAIDPGALNFIPTRVSNTQWSTPQAQPTTQGVWHNDSLDNAVDEDDEDYGDDYYDEDDNTV